MCRCRCCCLISPQSTRSIWPTSQLCCCAVHYPHPPLLAWPPSCCLPLSASASSRPYLTQKRLKLTGSLLNCDDSQPSDAYTVALCLSIPSTLHPPTTSCCHVAVWCRAGCDQYSGAVRRRRACTPVSAALVCHTVSDQLFSLSPSTQGID